MPDQPSALISTAWRRPIGSRADAYAHLVPDVQPVLGPLTAFCGFVATIWGPTLPSNRRCPICDGPKASQPPSERPYRLRTPF